MEWGERSSYESKELKLKREIAGEIRCSICPYHRGENARRKPREDKEKKIKRVSIRHLRQVDEIADKTLLYLED